MWTTAIVNKYRDRSFVHPCPQTQRISSSYPVPQPVLLSLWQKTYVKPLVINAIDITDTEAFGESSLVSRVKVDDNPKEQKYLPRQDARGDPSTEAFPEALPSDSTVDDDVVDYDDLSLAGGMTPNAPSEAAPKDSQLNFGSGMLVPASLGGGAHTGRAPCPLGERNDVPPSEGPAGPKKRRGGGTAQKASTKKAKATTPPFTLSAYELKRLATPDPNHDLDPDPSPNSIPNPNQVGQHPAEPRAPGRCYRSPRR